MDEPISQLMAQTPLQIGSLQRRFVNVEDVVLHMRQVGYKPPLQSAGALNDLHPSAAALGNLAVIFRRVDANKVHSHFVTSWDNLAVILLCR